MEHGQIGVPRQKKFFKNLTTSPFLHRPRPWRPEDRGGGGGEKEGKKAAFELFPRFGFKPLANLAARGQVRKKRRERGEGGKRKDENTKQL